MCHTLFAYSSGMVWLCLLSCLSLQQNGVALKTEIVFGGGVVEKKEIRRVIFLPSIPRGVCSGAFHSGCHISFPAVHICVCECASVRCVHVWTMWGSCSAVVIYSDGLWPYLFSISLMLWLPSSAPLADRTRSLGGTPSNLPGISTARTRTPTHTNHWASLFFLPLPSFLENFPNSRKCPAPTQSNNSFTPPLPLSLSRHISCFRSAESSLTHSVTCKHPHRHAHTHLGSHTHTHMDYIDYPFPAPTTTIVFVFSWCHVGAHLSFFETHSECARLQDILA